MCADVDNPRPAGPSVTLAVACALPAGLVALVLLAGRVGLGWFGDWRGWASLGVWIGLTVVLDHLLRRSGQPIAARLLRWEMLPSVLFCLPWLVAGLHADAWLIAVGGGLLGSYAGLVVLATTSGRPRRGLARGVLQAGAVGCLAIVLGIAWAFARDGAGSAGGWLGLWLAAWLMGRSVSFAVHLNKRSDNLTRDLARHHLLRGLLLLQGGFLTTLASDALLAACCFGAAFLLFPLSGLLDRAWQRRLLAEAS